MENRLKNIQTSGYNGTRRVFKGGFVMDPSSFIIISQSTTIPNHLFINFSDLKMDVRKTLCVLSRTRPQYLLQWNQLQSVIQSYGLILIVFLSLCEAIISDDLIVETTKGKIRGVTLKSATNK